MHYHSLGRHCEEQRDEAIQTAGAGLDCFAPLAMTKRSSEPKL
jgi:hypothetical protein